MSALPSDYKANARAWVRGVQVLGSGTGTAIKSRFINGLVSSRETVTWAEDDNVREITITAVQAAAGTANLTAVVAVCFDATSDAEALFMMPNAFPADTNATEVLFFMVPVNQPRTFFFSGPVQRCDVIRYQGSEAINVLIEAS